MQKSLEEFYTLAVFKPKPKAGAVFAGSETNSIFNQKEVVPVTAIQMERLAMAEAELQKALHSLMSAEAALVGFDDIEKRELRIAQNFTHGYIYMLREFVYQSKARREAVLKARAA